MGKVLTLNDFVEPSGLIQFEKHQSFTNNIIIMQFTGLLDKNGNEIYEGDIVSCEDEYGVVEYDPQQGGFIILFQPHNEKQKSGCAYLASTYPSPIKEIIGNIYQNPELLK